MKYCPYCGAGLEDDMRFCPKCGKPFEAGKANPNVSNITSDSQDHASESPPILLSPKKNKHGGLIALVSGLVVVALLGGLYFGGAFKGKPLPSDSQTTISATPVPEQIDVTHPTAMALTQAFSDNTLAIAEASNSVVMLSCFDKNGELMATGSGFIAFDDSTVITNFHVIEGSVNRITVQTEKNDTFDCSIVIAYDKEKDIAILRTDKGTKLPLLSLGNTEGLMKGEKVVAIGSPLGLINSVSSGMYSGQVEEDGQIYLQFTAAISSGSSGGALFDDSGKVIGITSASYVEGQNLNLAIPIESAIQLWENANDPVLLSSLYVEPEPVVTLYTVNEIMGDYARHDGEYLAVMGYLSYGNKLVNAPKDIVYDPTINAKNPALAVFEYNKKVNSKVLSLSQHEAENWARFSNDASIGKYVYVEGYCHVYYGDNGNLWSVTLAVDVIRTGG